MDNSNSASKNLKLATQSTGQIWILIAGFSIQSNQSNLHLINIKQRGKHFVTLEEPQEIAEFPREVLLSSSSPLFLLFSPWPMAPEGFFSLPPSSWTAAMEGGVHCSIGVTVAVVAAL